MFSSSKVLLTAATAIVDLWCFFQLSGERRNQHSGLVGAIALLLFYFLRKYSSSFMVKHKHTQLLFGFGSINLVGALEF